MPLCQLRPLVLLLLPVEAGHAGWLSDVFKGTSKSAGAPRKNNAAAPKRTVDAGAACR